MGRQRRHIRRSKYGRRFRAGKKTYYVIGNKMIPNKTIIKDAKLGFYWKYPTKKGAIEQGLHQSAAWDKYPSFVKKTFKIVKVD